MTINSQTPWHKASYDQFLNDRLPQLLAERLPLASYQVTPNEPNEHTCSITIELSGGVQVRYPSIPQPDEAGVFTLNGSPYVVVPLASQEELDKAEIACVGEQLYAYIHERLGQASNGLSWDEEILHAWLPLERWVDEFMHNQAQAPDATSWFICVQPLDTTNWLSRHTHLRRLLIPERQKVVAAGQTGRVCPFETPEGPNIGRVFTIAVGAEVRQGRLVVVDERPEGSLGLSASMLPFLEHNDPNRLLMAANMMRQGIPHRQPEPAWVQTGEEPDAPDFWCGNNLLTAFVSWGPGTSEDGILLSESAARRLSDPFPVEAGDKISNRHGSKGVVSYILPDAQMPHLADGTPAELVYNFPGLRTRMHLGQVREAVLGRLARVEGAPLIVPPFHVPRPEELQKRLVAAGLPESGMEKLRLGKDGPELELPSAAGWVYWTRLAHLAKDKLRLTLAESGDGPYAGQMLGEMEFGVLKELGATVTMHEALNARALRYDPSNAQTPIFADLSRRLQIAGIQAELREGRLELHFAAPQGEPLRLASPQPHPWLRSRSLEALGAVKGDEAEALPFAEYTRLVEANAQLSRMLSSRVPERLVREAETRLQTALDAFFAALLPGETLRFKERQRYSGRAVIAPGGDLRFDQVGLPEAVCWKLFEQELAQELGGEAIGPENPKAVQALDRLLGRSWLLINHAPSFASTALLAFHPVRQAGRVVRLNPLLCRWMNADFDGDQVAFYLPLSAAAQQEAGELLSVAGQLAHNPGLVRTMLPPPEVSWGLAWRSLTQEGRAEIARVAGVSESKLEQPLTQSGLTELLSLLLEREGVEKMLDIYQALCDLGYAAVRLSGASLSPFIRAQGTLPPAPQADDAERWELYTEQLAEMILSATNYHDPLIGPQLLDARTRLWKGRSLPMLVGVRGVVTDAQGKPFIVRHSYAEGFTPQEMYACVAGARQGFAELHVQSEQMAQEAQKRTEPGGLNVLARARRARYPGVVFARAAANAELDPLEDLDSRLLVGMA